MMIHAYNELYLSNAKDSLAYMFDYLINDCMLKADFAAAIFIATGYAAKFESGDPGILAGMSGVELGKKIIQKAYNKKDAPKEHFREDRSPEYWAGWSLAEYQWFSGKRFKDIFERVPMSKVLELYPLYHEMDISQFNDTMGKFYDETIFETKLKDFCKQTGIPRQPSREQVSSVKTEKGIENWGKSVSQKAVWSNKKAVDNLYKDDIIKSTKPITEVHNLQYIGKIDKNLYQRAAVNNILSDEVIITDNRIQHIIDRRGQAFYDEYSPYFSDIISNPDYIFKDKSDNTAIAAKTFTHNNTTVNLVVRLIVEGENSEFKNSILTAIKENEKRFKQRLRNNEYIYKKFDKSE